jgi:hypothetical protein
MTNLGPAASTWITCPITNHKLLNQCSICHPDRSVAKWRDLQFVGGAPKVQVISSENLHRE